ncbi:uncharacterized protein LOC130957472 [Arachis stenosperma]|uniref:uncharacterized protein LOC130957472 n=1 Tax=Arachis stenosperma TaxID=217475 RepID=UPI0025AD79F6|nr:uncharacterized protein LOC130957472 [Arachis stenosperma]
MYGCHGVIGKISPEYVSLDGHLYWINCSADQSSVPESIVIFSIITREINILPIPVQFRSHCHKILSYQEKVCFISYPGSVDNCRVSMWSIERRRNDSFSWKGRLKLQGVKIYDHPRLFIDKDLITLTDESIHTGRPSNEIRIKDQIPHSVTHSKKIILLVDDLLLKYNQFPVHLICAKHCASLKTILFQGCTARESIVTEIKNSSQIQRKSTRNRDTSRRIDVTTQHATLSGEHLGKTSSHIQPGTVEEDNSICDDHDETHEDHAEEPHNLPPDTMLQNEREGYLDMGDPDFECEHCGARFWYDERIDRHYNSRNPKFTLCCRRGQVQLPRLQQPPEILDELFFGSDAKAIHFQNNTRTYNSMFAFTSFGGKIDRSVNNNSRGPPTFILHGQNYHLMGSLLPQEGASAKFAQLYIYDTQNEIKNWTSVVSSDKDADKWNVHIVSDIIQMLDTHNVLTKSFRLMRDVLTNNPQTNVRLKLIGKRGRDGRTYNLPSVDEVAGLVVGDFDPHTQGRDIIVETKSGELKRISELHPSYLGLQYPLLFPYGEDGWREKISLNIVNTNPNNESSYVSMRDFFAFRIQHRNLREGVLIYSRRLFQQFIVDAYSMIEASRLKYVYSKQKEFRAEIYKGLKDAILNGETEASNIGKRIILPATFTGGPRYMIQNYQDAMAICRSIGYPDLFITFTCNPQWEEIKRYCKETNLKPEDRPDVICRLFKAKLEKLIKDIHKNRIFGVSKAVIYTIEFQKRGLPHAHILLFLAAEYKYPSPEDIDKIISAEIPDPLHDPNYYEAVKHFMVHGPCGLAKKNSPCMENGIELDNRYVVPHNRFLLLKYGAHINVEWCNQSRSIKYLFKYINKGNDRVTASFYSNSAVDRPNFIVDEIKMFHDCRYISPCESAWRIFAYDIHYRKPSVERLSFHLPDEQTVLFEDNDTLQTTVNRATIKESMFIAWFKANATYESARLLTYNEFPTHFVWKRSIRTWEPRKSAQVIGRLFFVPPSSGELYYLRMLLNIVRGPTSYEDVKTYNGVIYSSFRDACYARGLLDDDQEYVDAIEEASHWGSGHYVRKLFATLLWSNTMVRPEAVWEKSFGLLSDGILHDHITMFNSPDLTLSESELLQLTLIEIEQILNSNGKTLRDFPTMPYPNMENINLQRRGIMQNKLILDELSYDRVFLAEQHSQYLAQMTSEQKTVYDKIIAAVNSNSGGVFFLYGYGGTGKTFIWKTLSAAIRSKGEIVLIVASSGIASLLLPGGRTAHSRFAIPLTPDEYSTCNIKQGSPLAELISETKLIIWDEAPMMNKFCFEALDRTMRDLLRSTNDSSLSLPFGGKTVVFGGDFRQILPVITKGSRQDIVNASINSSYLWHECQILSLTQNMRLRTSTGIHNSEELKSFATWILNVGDGRLGQLEDGCGLVDIPQELLLTDFNDPIQAIVEAIYTDYLKDYSNIQHLQGRAILAPTISVVEEVNDYMLSLNNNEMKRYLSSDSPCFKEGDNDTLASIHTPEFLASIKSPGLPNHELCFKEGCPVMLIRNIDHSAGLCNGTRLVITRLGNKVIEAKVLSGSNIGEKVFIPRMTLTPSDGKLPFKFQRRQFPLMLSYAITINKSQGQSLNHVGLLLKQPVFTHGQLYVAVSRVTNKDGLKIIISHDQSNNSTSTYNVVYQEVFRNI